MIEYIKKEKYPHLYASVSDVESVNENLMFKCIIDSKRNLYLNGYVFGDDFFVPATFIMELIMEAGVLYFEIMKKKCVENIYVDSLEELSIKRGSKRLLGEKIETVFKVAGISAENCCITIYSERLNSRIQPVGIMQNASATVIVKDQKLRSETKSLPNFSCDEKNDRNSRFVFSFFPRTG